MTVLKEQNNNKNKQQQQQNSGMDICIKHIVK